MNSVLDIDILNGPQVRGNQILEDFNRLREAEPVYWSNASHCWIVTRHKDVSDGFSGEYPLINGGRSQGFGLMSIPPEDRDRRIPVLNKYIPFWITELDAPAHTRVRKLLMQAFNKKMVEGVRSYTQERVAMLLDQYQDSDCVELNEQIARAITGYVLFQLLGVPESVFPSLRDWSNVLMECFTTSGAPPEMLERADRAVAEINAVVLAELEKRKTEPKDDLLTAMLHASQDGETLSMDELLGAMHVLFAAGQESTSNTMTLGTEALSRHPEAWQYLYEHPEKMPECILELMRYTGMSGGQPRIVSEDFEWHGKQLKRGDLVLLSIVAANRDPRVFKEPEKLDFTRDNSASQVFAPGVHHCIGHLLAKMQVGEYFSAVVNRFRSVEILDDDLDFMKSFFFRGVFSMHVRFQKSESGVEIDGSP